MITATRQIVIGCGPGRCGTRSLARLLDLQPGVSATHEAFTPRIGWWRTWSADGSESIITALQRRRTNARIVSDVSFCHTAGILHFAKQCRVVYMFRETDAIVESYSRKTATRNHWQQHDGRRWKRCRWDRAYPKIDGGGKLDAIYSYVLMCNGLAAQAIAEYGPEQVRFVSTAELNLPDRVDDLLRWIGVENPVVRIVHENQSRTA